MPCPRLPRWVMELEDYSFSFTHIPGQLNGPADAMSRVEHGDHARILTAKNGNTQANKITQELAKPDTQAKDFFLDDDGLLYYCPDDPKTNNARLYAHMGMVKEILKSYHDDPSAGHRGIGKSQESIRRHLTTLSHCNVLHLSLDLFQKVALDTVGPLPLTILGNK
ncbi:hypothetical protein B566_EDAN010950 [Ephemera danica]|nr:hypothetical protein B566_EDAN010950 [Ephemera danica]